MWASGQLLDAEARQKADDKAANVHRVGLSPAAILRRAKAKREAARAASKPKQKAARR
jgi:hypothetical protein